MKLLKTALLPLFASALLVFVFTSCDPEPEVPNEEELITTVEYTLTSGAETVVLRFEDLDGDGPNDPVITGGSLTSNTSYSGSMTLLNEAETPAEDITTEIEEEDTEHQFFFSSTVTGLSIDYADTDDDGNPVGLQSTLTTGSAGGGSITIILRHEPAKSADGVADGDITNAGGETDIEVTFPIEVL